jgi:cell division protein FtsB
MTPIEKEIVAIRAGHGTGGYCDTEQLHSAEKLLTTQLRKELENLKPREMERRGEILKQLLGMSWKPKMVEAKEQ